MMKRIQLEYLFEDRPVQENTAPADYDALDIVSGGSHIYGQIMWPDGGYRAPRPCVVLLHGYPGTARNDDLVHALRRIGCVVLTPHHRGAWGSQGNYLVSHCVEDALAVAEYVHTPAFCEKYNTDPACVFLGGHSMGGNSTLNASRELPWLKGILLLTPFDPTRHIREGHPERLRALLPAGYNLTGYDEETFFRDIEAHVGKYDFEKAFDALKDQNICCVEGSEDLLAPGEEMFLPLWKLLQAHPTAAIQRMELLPTGHGLCDCRVALIRCVAQFLADVVNGET